MARMTDQSRVRFIVLDRLDDEPGLTVQDIVQPKDGAFPCFWRTWLRSYAGRPDAQVWVETIGEGLKGDVLRKVMLRDYARSA